VLNHVPPIQHEANVVLPMRYWKRIPDFKVRNWYNTFADNYIRLKKNSDQKLDEKIAGIVKLIMHRSKKSSRVFSFHIDKITQEIRVTGVII